MDTVTTSELLELFQNSVNLVDLQFQYWLSVTFAVIVSSYLAGNKLSIYLKVFIVILYLLTCGIFVTRYYVTLDQTTFISMELRSRLVDFPGARSLVIFFHQTVFMLGIGTTIWFVIFQRFSEKRDTRLSD